MEFDILGPLQIRAGEATLQLGAPKERAITAALLLRPNRVISTDRLIGMLWADPPPTAARTLQSYISKLRRSLDALDGGASAVVSQAPGYLLKLESDQLDLCRFSSLVAAAREASEAGDKGRALQFLDSALGLWRGEALEDIDLPFAILERRRLAELRLNAVEDRFETLAWLGRDADLLGELEQAAHANPLRERLQGLLMLALYKGGRQAEASAVYQRTREHLLDELGMEPGPELQETLREVLKQEVSVPARPIPITKSRTLPNFPTEFIGRSEQIRQVAQLVKARPVVTLLGPGGIGKTRLALRVAEEVEDDFAKGARWVDLAPVIDETMVLQRILAAVGVEEVQDGSPLDRLVEHLQDQSLLLVLDNCERLAQACVEVIKVIVAHLPTVRVLVTSRETLNLESERVWSVVGLTTPKQGDVLPRERLQRFEAVELFMARAREVRPQLEFAEGEVQAVAEICRRLDGMPLALELAAGQLFAISPADILERLDGRFGLLGGGARSLPARHQTMRDAIDWSHTMLSEEERILFRRLSVFVGGFDLPVAELVCAGESLQVHEIGGLITRLARKSMLSVEGATGGHTRYRLLETLRHYGLGRLDDAGEGEVLRFRHARAYAARAEPVANHKPSTSQTFAILEVLDSDYDDARMALEWSEIHDPNLFSELVANWARYWYARMRAAEGLRWLERGMQVEGLDPVRRGLMIMPLAAFQAGPEGLVESRRLVEEGLELADRLADRFLRARLINVVEGILRHEGDYQAARRWNQEGLDLARELGLPIPYFLINLAECEVTIGEVASARGHFGEAIAQCREQSSPNLSSSLISLGNLEGLEGNFDAARGVLLEALEITLETSDRFYRSEGCRVLAFVMAREGQWEYALRLRALAESLHREIGAPVAQWPFDDEGEQLLASIRLDLGEQTAQRLSAEGAAMTIAEAVDYGRGLGWRDARELSLVSALPRAALPR